MIKTTDDKRNEALRDIQRRFKALADKATQGQIKGSRSISYYCKAIVGNYAQITICDMNDSMDAERLALPRLFNAITLCALAQ